jgi:hypothetical protein
MTTLRIRVRNPMYANRHRYAHVVREFNEYEGEVYPRPRWVGEEYFCLTTGDVNFPFRTVAKDNIVDGWLLPTQNAGSNKQVYQIQGKKASTYLVTRENNKWSCNCTGFAYRRHCSHIEEAKEIA